MPTPAGTGLDRRTFVARRPDSPWPSTAGRRWALALFDEGIAAAPRRGAADECSSRSSSHGGADALSLLAPVERSALPRVAAALALAPAAGRRSPRTRP